jgi:hypothetical protein
MNVFQRFNISFLIAFGVVILFSCNDPSTIGSDLLDDDLIDVEFTDTFSINAITIQGEDSLLTYSDIKITNDLYTGQMDDPFFGKQTFDGFFLVGLNSVSPSFYDFDNDEFATVDSVILLINVDTTLYYGDKEATHNVDVLVLEEELDFDGEYYSNEDFATKMIPAAQGQEFKLNYEAYEFLFDGDTVTTAPSVRLKLDNSIGELLVMDTASVKNDTLLRDILPGFKIVNRPDETAVLPLDLSTKTLIDRGNKLFVFYTDTIAKFYPFTIGGVRHVYNEKDIAGSDLETAIATPSIGDSLLYVQGYGGADIKLEFPTANFETLGNVLLKKAEIEMTVADVPGDDDEIFQPMRLVYIDSEDPDTGERSRIIDLINASNAQALEAGFGGVLTEERDDNDELIRRYYTFNVTAYFQQLIDQGSTETGNLYLEAASPELILGRSIIYGPNHSTNPMKIKLTYSIPN